jgi:hypothetical protein
MLHKPFHTASALLTFRGLLGMGSVHLGRDAQGTRRLEACATPRSAFRPSVYFVYSAVYSVDSPVLTLEMSDWLHLPSIVMVRPLF